MAESDDARCRETSDRLMRDALDWLVETGWPTAKADHVRADAVYAKWLRDTELLWCSAGQRPRELLWQALEETFRPRHDERTADSLIVLFQFLAECRGRREGTLRRCTTH